MSIRVVLKGKEYEIEDAALASAYSALESHIATLKDGSGSGNGGGSVDPVPPVDGGLANWPTNPDATNPITVSFSYGKLIPADAEYHGLRPYDEMPLLISRFSNATTLTVENGTTWGDLITQYPNSGFSADALDRVMYNGAYLYWYHDEYGDLVESGYFETNYCCDIIDQIYVRTHHPIGTAYEMHEEGLNIAKYGGYIVEAEAFRGTIHREIVDVIYEVPELTTWSEFVAAHPEIGLSFTPTDEYSNSSGGTVIKGRFTDDDCLYLTVNVPWEGSMEIYTAYENEFVDGPFMGGSFHLNVERFYLE